MLKLQTNRTFTVPVPVTFTDEGGQFQDAQFKATYRMMSDKQAEDPENQGKRLLEMVLLSVDEIELSDDQGNVLQGDDLRTACLFDHTLATALTNAYWAHAAKKPRRAT